jgi:hypothetical protein
MYRNTRLYRRQTVAARAAVELIDSKTIAESQISYTAAEATKKDDEVVVTMVGQGIA